MLEPVRIYLIVGYPGELITNMKKEDVFNYYKPIPVVLGCFVNGLGIMRSFGRFKIPTIGLDFKKNIGMYSKYTKGIICPDPSKKEFIDFLIQLGKKLKNKGVLFPTYDNWLIPISKHQKELSKYYMYPMSDWDVIKKCVDKSHLYNIARENNIQYPKTLFIEKSKDIQDEKIDISFPCILKPVNPTIFMEKLADKKVILIKNEDELNKWINKIIDVGLQDTSLIIQEYIKGGPENLFTITAYSNNNFDVIAYSIGHKIRQYPPNSGTIISGRLEDIDDVYHQGSKLIKALGFQGISNIEFKRDPNGKFKLMEINPRTGKWTYSSTACGVNIIKIAYDDITGNKINGIQKTNNGKIWLTLVDDLYFSIFGYKRAGYPHAQISFIQWLKSIKGKKIYGILALTDPIPGIIFIWRKIT